MTDSSGHFEDVEVEGVFTNEKEAERFLAQIWADYVYEELDEAQVDELDKIIGADDFDSGKVEDFSNELDTMMAPSYDQMMDEYAIRSSNID